ncbi:MAG TPA: flagellar filament capping protein FliD [Bosea sp. (in: a-proteobacteria)]|jgi:flagellar hook-associated protein 2|uniref:flagellar filament capping protein FliD n=1 Tax=Bosea sp. (in: a-proteobacteria) TaxID=1871050 RepID=UPI002DDD600C|nr:flagellar filament capping protein FliD [Bosea sp. (in: a-proteobacteria)]HEV2555701.1 flagellar filament capping protein FliD [Bosea sp. (in: a-proteobacteria)]
MATVSSSTSASTTTYTSATATSATTDSSDIDWNALIEVAVQAKLSKADTIDLKITANEAKIAAYQELQSLLSDVADAADALRAVSGTSNSGTDVFLDRAAYLTANGDVDASAALSATVEDGSDVGSYDIQILQLAKAHKIAGSTQASKSEDLGLSGVMSLGVVDGEAVEVTITETMSLADIADAINAESEETGVQATVLRVSASSYRLVLSGVETGETIATSAVSGDDVLASLGLTDSDGAFADVLQEAQDAILTLDGITVTRSSNNIDDLLDGVTLHLYQTTQAGPDTDSDVSITLEVGADVSSAKAAIQSLVDAYNAFRDFVGTQQSLASDGTVAEDAVLFGDGTMRSATLSVYSALTATIDDESMALLGLSFASDGTLIVDEDALDNALLDDLDTVKALLSFQMDASSSQLKLLSRGTTVPAGFTLDISVDSSGAPSTASVGGDSSLFTVSGTRIIGAKGSIYEGYTLVFTGSSAQSIDVSLKTGIAELLYNAADPVADGTDGSIQTLIDNLTEVDDDLQTKSDAIRSAAETYRTNLSARYARYQAAIAAAESTQDYLTALIDQWNSSS